MNVEESIRQAIVGELQRQAETSDGGLHVEETETGVLLNGPVDLDELIMVVMGSIAGGP
ncbi:hypothetical protein [uncultured Aureimonas sp.]|uniref:hypothetical protein n=1 Tax=uncultured Aureimonas sp. TaxID=1604662 RepID=UPI0025E507A7|nr:hypothetical protein [uncultured Aureimonas sp.]